MDSPRRLWWLGFIALGLVGCAPTMDPAEFSKIWGSMKQSNEGCAQSWSYDGVLAPALCPDCDLAFPIRLQVTGIYHEWGDGPPLCYEKPWPEEIGFNAQEGYVDDDGVWVADEEGEIRVDIGSPGGRGLRVWGTAVMRPQERSPTSVSFSYSERGYGYYGQQVSSFTFSGTVAR